MIYLFKIYDRIISACKGFSQEDSKRIAELSMALHYIRRLYLENSYSVVDIDKIQKGILDYIHTDGYFSLLDNNFLLQQNITPYVFIRNKNTRSDYFEGLLEVFKRSDLSVQESFPYRALERNHLLYKIGLQPITISFESQIFIDALQIQSFNRDLSYAFTHTVFYSTDFSDQQLPNQKVKDCCKILMAKSFNDNDIDLFFEICICLLSQKISKDELKDMITLIQEIKTRNLLLFECSDITKDYHPLFVHDILRGLMLKKFDLDISAKEIHKVKGGPIRSLSNIIILLKGKDPEKILNEYLVYSKSWGRMFFLEKIIRHKLKSLNLFACHNVLFEREFLHLGQYNFNLYDKYQEKLSKLTMKYDRNI